MSTDPDDRPVWVPPDGGELLALSLEPCRHHDAIVAHVVVRAPGYALPVSLLEEIAFGEDGTPPDAGRIAAALDSSYRDLIGGRRVATWRDRPPQI